MLLKNKSRACAFKSERLGPHPHMAHVWALEQAPAMLYITLTLWKSLRGHAEMLSREEGMAGSPLDENNPPLPITASNLHSFLPVWVETSPPREEALNTPSWLQNDGVHGKQQIEGTGNVTEVWVGSGESSQG